jgi:hypothetical protein
VVRNPWGRSISLFPKIVESLEHQEARKNLAEGKRAPVYDFSGFQIAWPLMVLYGVLLLNTIALVSSFIGGALSGRLMASQGKAEDVKTGMYLAGAVGVPLIIMGGYLLGRWIGTRCSRRGVIVVLLVVLGNAVISTAIEHSFPMGDTEVPILSRETSVVRHTISACVLLLVLLIGYWYGRKYRLAKYLHYLLSVLPVETRDVVVELAFDEAQKVASAAGRAHISATR